MAIRRRFDITRLFNVATWWCATCRPCCPPGQYGSLTLFAACGVYLLSTLLTIRFNWQTRSV